MNASIASAVSTPDTRNAFLCALTCGRNSLTLSAPCGSTDDPVRQRRDDQRGGHKRGEARHPSRPGLPLEARLLFVHR